MCFFLIIFFYLIGLQRDKRETLSESEWFFFFYVDMRCSFVALTESIKNTIKKALHLVLQHDRSEGFKGAGTQCDHGEGKKCFEPQFQRKVKVFFFSDLAGDSIYAVLMSLWSLKVKLRLSHHSFKEGNNISALTMTMTPCSCSAGLTFKTITVSVTCFRMLTLACV